ATPLALRLDTRDSSGSGTSEKSDTRCRTPHTEPCPIAPSTRCGIAPCTRALSAAAASLDVFEGTALLLRVRSRPCLPYIEATSVYRTLRSVDFWTCEASVQRSFAQPAACLHVPAKLTPEPTKHEGRKRRASERHAVGCCEELGRRPLIYN